MEKIKNRLRIPDPIIRKTYWDVTKSGKVVELCIRPSIDANPEEYRLGTIQIGRIISYIQSLAAVSNTSPQIQLFPNLAENQLAATIYWPALLSSSVPKLEDVSSGKHSLTADELTKICSHYNLFTKELPHDEAGTTRTYHILSRSNQPFIWLKVGQFIQELSERSNINTEHNPYINILRPERLETPEGKVPVYPQAEVKLPSGS